MSKLSELGPLKSIKRRINLIEVKLAGLRIRPGKGLRLGAATSVGTYLHLDRQKATVSTGAEPYLITAVKQNYVSAKKYTTNDTTSSAADNQPGQTVSIAKPKYLRYSAGSATHWSNDNTEAITYAADATGANADLHERTAKQLVEDGSNAQILEATETVFPAYNVNDLIWAVKWSNFPETLNDEDENAITWFDINVDGRHWRMTRRLIKTCVNNTTIQNQIFPAGTPVDPPA